MPSLDPPFDRVILVEDNELVRDVLAEALGGTGQRILAFATAEEAMARPEAFDGVTVLITDVDLGGDLDGLALAARARRRYPSLRVIYITGRPERMRGRSLEPGDRFLAKPFHLDTLLEILRQLRPPDAAPSAVAPLI